MTLSSKYNRFGLIKAQAPKRRRLVFNTMGLTGTGKSDLMLRTAPRPLLVINLDRNVEPLEERYLKDGDLYFKHVRMPRRLNQEQDEKIWSEVRELYEMAMQEEDGFRSVLIDTGDALYELLRRAKLGSLDFGEVPRALYSTVNSNMKWIYSLAKDKRVNLCVAHKMTAEFVEAVGRTGKRTAVESGRMKRAGWKEADYEAQMCVRLFKDPAISGVDKYRCEIVKCTASPDLEDPDNECHILTGADITFQNLGMLACPWSEREDWS